ncbi:hypothetical protein Poly51_48580 [Rubripirellula tenax]|uniref:Lipoprotein n=1 Tax=Rubripirellula tenax TaxID=2528015 RepID=A0A5C6EKD4_9BACT|nr:hypothetical protein Poly51_48580 [Rubripirellula tenax]
MDLRKSDFLGIAVAIFAAFLTSIMLAGCAGVFFSLFASSFAKSDGQTSIWLDLIAFPLFVYPPYVLCGLIAERFAIVRWRMVALISGILYTAFVFVGIPTERWQDNTLMVHILPVLPLTLLGGYIGYVCRRSG